MDQAKQRDYNYTMLRTHLKNTNQHLDNNLFKTVLYAINAITIYNKTIPEAFRMSINKYNLEYDHFATLKQILYRMFDSKGNVKEVLNNEQL